ncbi:hypothetical protein EIN_484780 [Entamoeba invadens IP1]|uniref:Uncharacterized protein n=1 Tax=Entamoeba invadens IP1 TaxID=370355 RepID=A0A0A1U4F6_ENTIV|nr:hypothetical protein EIN_484780 [Entamoeba invadens IP1]ELP89136.1 hypothetical protein EIN_484780 [Entamoeba invadens IP1]|eukprot:XP_004255907.1 hypothetical protein EIN_484780 [Entamoeba invadens IP1]
MQLARPLRLIPLLSESLVSSPLPKEKETESLDTKRGSSVNAQKERQFKNQQAYQESYLLALLNQFFSITLERPGKQSKMTSSMPIVLSLELNGDNYDIKAMAEKQCDLIQKEEVRNGVSEKTVSRRYKKNVTAFMQTYLFDFCEQLGFVFDSKRSKQSNKTLQVERIENVYFNGNLVATKDEVLEKGRSISQFLFERVDGKKKRRVVLPVNCDELKNFTHVNYVSESESLSKVFL